MYSAAVPWRMLRDVQYPDRICLTRVFGTGPDYPDRNQSITRTGPDQLKRNEEPDRITRTGIFEEHYPDRINRTGRKTIPGPDRTGQEKCENRTGLPGPGWTHRKIYFVQIVIWLFTKLSAWLAAGCYP